MYQVNYIIKYVNKNDPAPFYLYFKVWPLENAGTFVALRMEVRVSLRGEPGWMGSSEHLRTPLLPLRTLFSP